MDFPCKKFLEDVEKKKPQVWLKILTVLEAISEGGANVNLGKAVETYDGPIRNIHAGGNSYPVRVYFVAGKERRVWIIWACFKNQEALPSRDDAQVRKRAAEAKER